MAVTRRLYQTAHITIVVAYTAFCVSVLGIEHPIFRLLAALISGTPVLWAIWVLALSRVPAETITERLREALSLPTASGTYQRVSEELAAMAREAKELMSLAGEVEAGRMSPEAGFHRRHQIEQGMKRRVERIGDVVR